MFPVSKSLDCEFHGNLEAAFQPYFHTTNTTPARDLNCLPSRVTQFIHQYFQKATTLRHLLGGISSSRQLEKACLQYMIMYATPSPKLVKSSLKLSSDKHWKHWNPKLCTGSLLPLTTTTIRILLHFYKEKAAVVDSSEYFKKYVKIEKLPSTSTPSRTGAEQSGIKLNQNTKIQGELSQNFFHPSFSTKILDGVWHYYITFSWFSQH